MAMNDSMLPTRQPRKGYGPLGREILEYWKAQGMTLYYTQPIPVAARLKRLIEQEDVTLEEIKLAIRHYGMSDWHKENQMWKQPLAFLVKDLIKQWLTPRVSKQYSGSGMQSDSMGELHEMINVLTRGEAYAREQEKNSLSTN